MKPFLLDILHDLRSKRLLPVAALLLLALVAVPLVLIKPAAEPVATAPPPVAASDRGTPAVNLAGPETGSSDLGVFDPKDPFRSPVSTRRRPSTSLAPSTTPPSAPSAPAKGGGSGSVGGGGSSSGGGSSPPPSTTPSPSRPKVVAYTYVVDVTFGLRGQTRQFRGLQRFRTLPNQRSPLLVFLGVDATAKRAVFLLDSRLRQGGEGSCRPTRERCSLLSLRTDDARDQHVITAPDGQRYGIRLDRIRKVPIAKSAAAPPTRGRAFVPPTLIDVEAGE
ncbi:MAG: hypothetical protein ACR2FZ_07225 [Thermoleophilaceae bacterium]